MRWRLRERVLGPFGDDSAEVEPRDALGDAGDPPAGEPCCSMEPLRSAVVVAAAAAAAAAVVAAAAVAAAAVAAAAVAVKQHRPLRPPPLHPTSHPVSLQQLERTVECLLHSCNRLTSGGEFL